MKQRLFFLTISLFLVAGILLCPRSRQIETTVEATEYSFADPTYAVMHTVTIRGCDTRSLIGYGRYEGTFAVDGWELADAGWTMSARFPVPDNYRNVTAVKPSGEPLSTDLLSLLPDRNWTAFVGVIQTIEDAGDHRYGFFDPSESRFLVSGTLSREEALAEATRLTRSTALTPLFADR